jgi:hypothetical protein
MTTLKAKAKAKRKPRAKPTPADINAAAELMAEQMSNYQDILADSMTRYEEMVAKASADLDKLVRTATPVPPKEKIKPECQWLEKDSGKYLVMNEAAAEFFGAIFEQVGVLANELQKQTK